MEKRTRYDDLVELCAIETDECVLWPHGKNNHGYGIVRVDGRQAYAHRTALSIATGELPVDRCAAHSCRSTNCVNYRHLRWATVRENAGDRLRDGTQQDSRGTANGNRKLSDDEVALIRNSDESRASLSQRYGVHPTTISKIRLGQRWSHLPAMLALT